MFGVKVSSVIKITGDRSLVDSCMYELVEYIYRKQLPVTVDHVRYEALKDQRTLF